MGRKISTLGRILSEKLKPELPDTDTVNLKDAKYKEHDIHHSVKPLTELKLGDPVRIKTDKDTCKRLSTPGRICQSVDNRSYILLRRDRNVETEDIYRESTRTPN